MRSFPLALRIIRQFLHDKRTLAMMIVAPMLILWLMSQVFNADQYVPNLAAVQVSAPLMQQLEAQGAEITAMDADQADEALRQADVDAVVSFSGGKPSIRLEGSDPSVNRSVLMIIQETLAQSRPDTGQVQPEVTYLHGSKDMAAFDSFGPVLIGFFVFFFTFLLSGVSFLRERTGGTLERLMTTPIRRGEIVLGYILGFGLFTMIQSALVAWFAIDLLDMMMVGSFGYVLLITLLAALTALSLGTLLSAFANTEFQVIQFIPVVIIPQVFLSGLFNLETMADWLRWLGAFMPLSYAADALRDVMIRGQGWADIAGDVYALLGFSIFFIAANVLALRKHRPH